MSDEGVYRTAPATAGLLNIITSYLEKYFEDILIK